MIPFFSGPARMWRLSLGVEDFYGTAVSVNVVFPKRGRLYLAQHHHTRTLTRMFGGETRISFFFFRSGGRLVIFGR